MPYSMAVVMKMRCDLDKGNIETMGDWRSRRNS